jgi:cell wall-associated NlpC family hydrolase
MTITDGQRQTAVQYALAQVGKGSYQFNAPLTGNAYDCSSLTLRSWLAAGVHIPRNSLDQADPLLNTWVTLVPYVERNILKLKAGDLVFYYPNDWSHVAIYTGQTDAQAYLMIAQATNGQRGIEKIRMNAYTPAFTFGFMGHA